MTETGFWIGTSRSISATSGVAARAPNCGRRSPANGTSTCGSGRAGSTFSWSPRSWWRSMSGGSGCDLGRVVGHVGEPLAADVDLVVVVEEMLGDALPLTIVPLVLPRSSRNESARMVTTCACSPDTAGYGRHTSLSARRPIVMRSFTSGTSLVVPSAR